LTSARSRAGIRTDDDWPYGLHKNTGGQQILVDWAEANDVRLSHAQGSRIDQLRSVVGNDVDLPSETHSWVDHATVWKRDRTPVAFVSHPYSLSADDLVSLGHLAMHDRLTVSVRGGGWYGQGAVMVEVWRTAELKRTSESH